MERMTTEHMERCIARLKEAGVPKRGAGEALAHALEVAIQRRKREAEADAPH
jgi:hypothetical protein